MSVEQVSGKICACPPGSIIGNIDPSPSVCVQTSAINLMTPAGPPDLRGTSEGDKRSLKLQKTDKSWVFCLEGARTGVECKRLPRRRTLSLLSPVPPALKARLPLLLLPYPGGLALRLPFAATASGSRQQKRANTHLRTWILDSLPRSRQAERPVMSRLTRGIRSNNRRDRVGARAARR
jgi:hypothetical protein